MVRFISNIPIFRRLFIAFAIAALIPGIVIVLLGNFYISSLNNRGEAVRTSFDAQSAAAQQETNLQQMSASLDAYHYEIFGALSGVITDPSYFYSGASIGSGVKDAESSFDQALTAYPGNFDINTSPNMSNIKNILLSDDPTNGQHIIDAQNQALATVQRLWPTYKQNLNNEL